MRSRSLRVTVLTTLLLVSTQVAAVAERFTDRFEKTYDVGAGAEISLQNTNGSVSIEIWERDAVEVIAEKRVNARDAETARRVFDDLKIVITQSDDRLEIETDHPSSSSSFLGWLFGRGSSNTSVSYELRVPRSAALAVRTVNGNVATTGAEGRQRLRSTNGRIEVDGAHHEVDAHTTNGSIDVEIDAGAEPEIALGTTNGSITLHLPGDARGSLEARTVNGSVRTDLPVRIDGSVSKRRLNAELNGGGAGRIVLRTVNGSIRILETTV